ncbi:MAG: biotin--[acetyl-CoA-carboxylase] ligase [Wenzhouxiangella sp.]|nr:biotin--[acetyl-CoA-carboxylase] ligase [Wenzhouxiangella sp.]TVR92920.1 MAG: biotin--[acetyl-CoA-carboxylase] ligase [Wenzhouxiangellaceae bacterium]
MNTTEAVLRRLGDGRAHQPGLLRDEFGLSADAFARVLDELARLGLPVHQLGSDGIQLDGPIDWLDGTRLAGRARTLGLDLTLEWLCESTNSRLHDALHQGRMPCVLLAEAQSGGRGRRGRGWVSPPGAGLYLSLAWRSTRPPAELAPLALIVGMAAAGVLREIGVAAMVKWPNDLQVDGCKLGGCLVEVAAAGSGPSDLVLGLGINCRLPSTTELDQPWTDLHRLGISTDRTELAIRLIDGLVEALRQFDREGAGPALAQWSGFDALAGRMVDVVWDHGRQLSGPALGIDQAGRLLVGQGESALPLHSGEVRVRSTA